MRIDFEPNCGTTAMGVMPHRDPSRALDLAFSLDVPYWPQLPRLTFTEDMFAQFARGFPGARVDLEGRRVDFDTSRFAEELADYSDSMDRPEVFDITDNISSTYGRFLGNGLSARAAVRGQWCGPVNFGFRVTDEERRPIIYNDEIRTMLFDFAQRSINTQYQQLAQRNRHAFVWVDEPGLGWVFNSFAGYNELQAQGDYRAFLDGFDGPRALHLCLNVHLPYLFGLGLDILSIDAFQFGEMPKGYSADIAMFIRSGGIICWGLVPTESVTLDPETPETLFRRLTAYWDVVVANSGISTEHVARQALIAPAKCCIKNAIIADMDEQSRRLASCTSAEVEEDLVERAFSYLREVSGMLREHYRLP